MAWMRRSRRAVAAVAAASAIALVLAACGSSGNESGASGASQGSGGSGAGSQQAGGGGSSQSGSGSSQEASGGGESSGGGGSASGESENLVVGTTDSVAHVDPAACYSYFCSNILQNVGQTLVGYKPGSTALAPILAKDLPKISDDGLTYTFTLRQGVKFQDGSDMTSKDVKFSLDRALWMAHPQGAGFLLGDIKSIDTPDDSTVVIHLDHVDSTFSSKLAYQVATIVASDAYKTPTKQTDGSKAKTWENKTSIVATGPYKLADYRQGESITLEAWDGYWGDPPPAKKVLIKFYGKSAQLLAALKSGEVDIAFRSLTPVQRGQLQKGQDSSDIKVVSGPGASIHYIVLNVLRDPVKDVNVRKAIAAGIDRDRLIQDALGGDAKPLFSMIPPGYKANDPTFKQYDNKKPSDFIGDKKIDLTLWYGTDHYGPTEPKIAQSVMRMLNETGSFNVTTKSAPWAQFTEDAYPGKSGQYSAFLLGWYPDYLDADDYVSPFYTCDSFLAMYCNDTMEKLVKQEQNATSPESDERMATFKKIQDLAAADAPLIPMVVLQPFAFAHKDVHGISDTMGPEQIFRYYMISKSKS